MIRSLFYKEWIKTWKILLLALVAFAAFLLYTFINVQEMFRVSGAVAVWTDTLLKDINVLSKLQWLPLVVSILFGLSQFVPEMTNKRLKLTLHLPMPEDKITFAMLAYGVLCLLALYGIVYATILIGLQMYYPAELVLAMFNASLPWFMAGLIGYLLVAWICLEPVWRQRVFNSLIAVYTLTFFMLTAKSGAFAPFIPYLMAATLVVFFFSFYSMCRFKDGAQ